MWEKPTDYPEGGVNSGCCRSIISGEMAENEVRKGFTPSERVAIGHALEAELGNRQGQRTDKPLQVFAEVEAGKTTRDIAAEKSGFGNPEHFE